MMFCRRLNARANYSTYTLKRNRFETTIVLYDDHRCILNVLNEFRKTCKHTLLANSFSGEYQVPDVVFFDRHDDARELSDDVIEMVKNLDKDDERKFWNFVEFDVTPLDDNWVCLAMELNLANNVVVFGNKENDNIAGMEKMDLPTGNVPSKSKPSSQYIDSNGYKHILFSFKNCFDLDKVLKKSNSDIDKIVRNCNDNYLVLDFDLDCFSNGKKCWEENKIKKFCSSPMLNELVNFASVITICREPECCGGINQSNKILKYLDKYLFKGCLNA